MAASLLDFVRRTPPVTAPVPMLPELPQRALDELVVMEQVLSILLTLEDPDSRANVVRWVAEQVDAMES